ncbi:MAG: carboxypeptidase-like regulatory domain-containing protein [Kofleriaceae bacterium]
MADPAGFPMAGVVIKTMWELPHGHSGAFTDDDGRYRLEEVPAGLRTVEFFYGERQSSVSEVAVVAGTVMTVDWVLDVDVAPIVSVSRRRDALRTGAIKGWVHDREHQPMAGVVVMATSQQTGTSRTALSTTDGSYQLADLPAGDHDVMFFHGHRAFLYRDVNVGAQKTTSVFHTLDRDSTSPGPVTEIVDVGGGPPRGCDFRLGAAFQSILISE